MIQTRVKGIEEIEDGIDKLIGIQNNMRLDQDEEVQINTSIQRYVLWTLGWSWSHRYYTFTAGCSRIFCVTRDGPRVLLASVFAEGPRSVTANRPATFCVLRFGVGQALSGSAAVSCVR